MTLTRFHKILLGALAVQLALVVLVFAFGSEPAFVRDAPLLPGFDVKQVTRVRVFSNNGEKPAVELVKRGEAWVVASHFDYPGDATKITSALSPLGTIAAGEPIATSATRHKQLRVADRDFERKIVIDAAGGEKTIYFGGSTGSRRVAVRLAGAAVYSATGVVPVSSEPQAFVATKYLDVPKAEINKLVVKRGARTIEIERVKTAAPVTPATPAGSGSAAGAGSGSAAAADPLGLAAGSGSAAEPAVDSWKLAIDGAPVTLAAGESIDTDAIERLLGQAGSLDLKTPGDPKRDAAAPLATVTIHKQGAPNPIVFDVLAEGEPSYWVHQRDNKLAIIVDKYQLGELVPVERDKLVKKPAPAGAGSGAGSAALPPGMELPPGMQLPPGMPPIPN